LDNIVQKVKSEITEIVTNSIEKAIKSGLLNIEDMPSIEIEEPKEKQFGDLSINTAMVMAKSAKMPPRKIAEIIKDGLELKGTLIDKVEIAGPGFYELLPK
jgi:arginyl-tRNA synthetase